MFAYGQLYSDTVLKPDGIPELGGQLQLENVFDTSESMHVLVVYYHQIPVEYLHLVFGLYLVFMEGVRDLDLIQPLLQTYHLQELVEDFELGLEVAVFAQEAESLFDDEELFVALALLQCFKSDAEAIKVIVDSLVSLAVIDVGVQGEDEGVFAPLGYLE